MGFNLGAALGAAAQSGVNAYTTFNREARDQEMFEAWRKEQAIKEADRIASLDTFGKVGQTQYNDLESALPQIANGTAIGDGQGQFGPKAQTAPVAALPAGAEAQPGTSVYTREQAEQDYLTRLRANNPEKALTYESTALQVKGLRRKDTNEGKEDELSAWMANSSAVLNSGDAAAKQKWAEDNLPSYNKPAKGSRLDDGNTATIVQGSDGSSSFVQTNKSGKVVSSTPINDQTLQAAFKELTYAKFEALPGNLKEAFKMRLEREKLALEGRKVDAQVAAYGATANYYNTQANSLGPQIGVTNDVTNPRAVFNSKKGLVYQDGTSVGNATFTPMSLLKPTEPTVARQDVIVTDPETGKETKMAVHVVTKMTRDGKPEITYYDTNNQQITDPGLIKQFGAVAIKTQNEILNEKADTLATAYMEGGTLNPKTGEPFKTAKEARAYALQTLTRDPNQKPTQSELNTEKVESVAQALLKAGEVNPTTKKPYTPEEATVAAWKMSLRAPAPTDLTPMQKVQYTAYQQMLKAEIEQDPKFVLNSKKMRDLAARFPALGPEVLGTAVQVPYADLITANTNPDGTLKTQPPKAAIDEPQSAVAMREVQRQLKEHMALDPARNPSRAGGARAGVNSVARLEWDAERKRLVELLDSLKPGGVNYRLR